MKEFYLGYQFLYRMLSKQSPELTLKTVNTLASIPETALSVITPQRPPSRGDIVLLHGMSIKGNSDARILKLAHVSASLGFTVWLPQLNEITNHEIHRDATERLNTLLVTLKQNIAGPLAIMAPSYLGTIALNIAADSQRYIPIDALCCIGVFCHSNRFMQQIIRSENIDPYGRGVFLKNLLLQEQRLTPGIHQVFEQIFLNVQEQRDYMTAVNLSHLNPEEYTMLLPLTQGDQWHTIGAQLQQLGPLLPASAERMPATKTKLAFIHGKQDTLASAEEILPFVSHLPTQQWRVAIPGSMDHGHHALKLHQIPAIIRLAKAFGFFFNHALTC